MDVDIPLKALVAKLLQECPAFTPETAQSVLRAYLKQVLQPDNLGFDDTIVDVFYEYLLPMICIDRNIIPHKK